MITKYFLTFIIMMSLFFFGTHVVLGQEAGTDLVLYGVDSASDGLSIIDPVTGEINFVGPLHPDPNIYVTPITMAVRPSDGKIFVWNNSDVSIGTGVLLTVDPCTGLATPVDPSTPPQDGIGESLAFSPDDRLFAASAGLREIDPSTGMLLREISFFPIRLGGIDFDPISGILYGVELTSEPTQRLVAIDINTGSATVVADLSENVGIIGSIVFDPSGQLIGSSISQYTLFNIDPETGFVSNFRSTFPVSVPQGMGFAPVCSPPSSVEIGIDISPNQDPNIIYPDWDDRKNIVYVSALTTSSFDATTIDPTTVEFGPDGAKEIKNVGINKDVDLDGDIDITFRFRVPETGIQCGDVSATLTGMTYGGQYVYGTDSIQAMGQCLIPDLLIPEEGAILDNGRTDRTDGLIWDFDWFDVPNATKYHLYVIGPTALYPIINQTALTTSSYHFESPGTYIIEANSAGWRWKVRAFVYGQWADWSEERYFDVEPVNTDSP